MRVLFSWAAVDDDNDSGGSSWGIMRSDVGQRTSLRGRRRAEAITILLLLNPLPFSARQLHSPFIFVVVVVIVVVVIVHLFVVVIVVVVAIVIVVVVIVCPVSLHLPPSAVVVVFRTSLHQ
jgi:hypothetical protein